VVIRPVARFFLAVSRWVQRLLGVRPGDQERAVTEDDIRTMAVLGEQTGDIERAEREIIHSLFSLDDLTVRDVMTPRAEIHSLESPVTFDAVRALAAATGHSRFPVIKDDLDHLIGILHLKDLIGMPTEPTTSDIHRVIRYPVLVPESKSVLDLLSQMRAERVTLAVVTDEHGGIEGIVTVTDAVSELVGEIQDEHDPLQPEVVEDGAGRWVVDGRSPIEDVEEVLGTSLPQGEYATIAGLVLDRAGRIPRQGDVVEIDGYRLEVLRVRRNRVERVVIVPTGEPAGGD
jgi:putative hemolysin